MMFGWGFLFMSLVMALPVLLLISVVIALVLIAGRIIPRVSDGPNLSLLTTATCKQCGMVMQNGWAHCPHCGASI